MYDDFFKELTLPGVCLELSRHFFVSYTKFSINYHYRRFYSNERRMDKFCRWQMGVRH